ncbi:MAG: putative Kinase binding protein [Promethearchaeota archaeon]|nr:MAG: putative Kinase binding protein [Candidatus Lokiarchaeota archaeon]
MIKNVLMITEDFYIEEINLSYSVLISKIELAERNYRLQEIFDLIERFQQKFSNIILQFFDPGIILNEDHIFSAIYFMVKAFKQGINISNKKNIELLLYLSGNRQIKKALPVVGISETNIKKKELYYCIISSENEIKPINEEILEDLDAKVLDLDINHQTINKFNKIKDHFKISDEELMVVLNSYGIDVPEIKINMKNIEDYYYSLMDLVCERMALLSLDSVKLDLD